MKPLVVRKSMPFSRRYSLLLIVVLLCTLLLAGRPPAGYSSEETSSYIVRLADPPLASYRGGIADLAPTNPRVLGEVKLDVDSPASVAYLNYLETRHGEFRSTIEAALGRSVDVTFDYRYAFNGLAVVLTEAEAATVASLPGVVDVDRDAEHQLLTDAGPAWIGAPAIWSGDATGEVPGTRGEGVVVGVIDTGINHDHPSFADVGGDGYDHTNPRGQFYGLCDKATGEPFCNDKLIGVYDFTGTSPEDDHSHGSHTASTAAGNVLQATVYAPTVELTQEVSGVAPHANLITYKGCSSASCLTTSLLKGIDQATADEVDVINYSIGSGSSDPWDSSDALAFLGARDAGIIVASSAGNSGPAPGTVGSPADAPWVMAVGASTHNRKFGNSLINMSGGETPPADLSGKSLTSSYGPAPIVHASDYGDAKCLSPFAPGTFNGEIVVCDRGTNPRVEKGRNVQVGGAGGFVLANTGAQGESTVADAHYLPGLHVGFQAGETLRTWLANGSGHTATIAGTSADVADENGDIMAGFSSRGANPSVPNVMKPDVTAPGVDILAAYKTTDPTAPPEFGLMSGTSMSGPHAAGAAALVRAVHPDWTPAEVVSALTSTGLTGSVRKEDGLKAADPFDMGGGRIDLTQAAEAGLVLDETVPNFEVANPSTGGDPKALNLATLANADCGEQCTWTRTVSNSLSVTADWKVRVSAPRGLDLSVEPSSFSLEPGASQELTITANASRLPLGNWVFGQIQLSTKQDVAPDQHFPVAVLVQTPTPVSVTTLETTGTETVSIEAEADADKLTATIAGLQEGRIESQVVEQDPTPLDRYDIIGSGGGTRFFLIDVPAGARLLTAKTEDDAPERDIDLAVGLDADGDGQPDAGEEYCVSASPTANEACTLRTPAAGTYWVLVQTWLAGVDMPTIEWAAAVIPGTDNGNLTVTAPSSVTKGQTFDVALDWNEPALEPGDTWFAMVEFGSDKQHPADVGAILIDLTRNE